MRAAFEYAVLRIVPDVAREEFVNVGVVAFCDADAQLWATVELDEKRLRALDPDVDLEDVRRHLDAVVAVCRGGAGSGPIGELPPRERWRWLVAPRSTILQTSPAHGGLADDPAAAIDRVVDRVVRRAPSKPAPPVGDTA